MGLGLKAKYKITLKKRGNKQFICFVQYVLFLYLTDSHNDFVLKYAYKINNFLNT